MSDRFSTCPDCGRLLLGSWDHECEALPPLTEEELRQRDLLLKRLRDD